MTGLCLTRNLRYFYPRSPCGERLNGPVSFFNTFRISIHALLAESDLKTPCVKLSIEVFLSTLSLRRATTLPSITRYLFNNFYPRSPCGERPFPTNSCCVCSSISIHALLAESDPYQHASIPHRGHFYPRSPCGERRKPRQAYFSILRFLSTLSLRRATKVSLMR